MIDLQQLAAQLRALPPEERAAAMNASMSGFDALVGMRLRAVGDDEVVATLTATAAHTQPYGLVHGGVYATLGESVCSIGAALVVMAEGKNAVGVENTTCFLRAVRPGTTITITARPKAVSGDGRRHTWAAVMIDAAGERCAVSEVTVAALPARMALAGQAVRLSGGGDPSGGS